MVKMIARFVTLLSLLSCSIRTATAEQSMTGADIGHGLKEPPGPGWQKGEVGEGAWYNLLSPTHIVLHFEDPEGRSTPLRDQGFIRTPRGWVKFKELKSATALVDEIVSPAVPSSAPAEDTDIGHGLHEPPGPGWEKSQKNDNLWFNLTADFYVVFAYDASGQFEIVSHDGYIRTPHGWVKFTPRSELATPPPVVPPPQASTARDAPGPPAEGVGEVLTDRCAGWFT